VSLNAGAPALRPPAGLPLRRSALDLIPMASTADTGDSLAGAHDLPQRPRRGEGGQAGDIGPMPRRRRRSGRARPAGGEPVARRLTEVERIEALIRGHTDVGPMSLSLPLRRRAGVELVALAGAVAAALAWAGTTLDLAPLRGAAAVVAAVAVAAIVMVVRQPRALRADVAGLRLGRARVRWEDLGGLSVSSRLTGLLRRRVLTITTRHGFEHHLPAVNLAIPPEDAIGAIVGWCQSRGIDTSRWFLLRFPDGG
jgi:hypothetical protein